MKDVAVVAYCRTSIARAAFNIFESYLVQLTANGKRWIASLGVGWRGAPRVTRQQRPALTGETRSR